MPAEDISEQHVAAGNPPDSADTEREATPPSMVSTLSDATALERAISSEPDFEREQSTLSDLKPPDTFKKKKKKRVGGIAFAVTVEEQVIATNDEEMTQRQEHWRSIQEKANDPNTVRLLLEKGIEFCQSFDMPLTL